MSEPRTFVHYHIQGDTIVLTAYERQMFGTLYNNATHRLSAAEVRKLRDDCDKALANPPFDPARPNAGGDK